jgi:hypothetical protein
MVKRIAPAFMGDEYMRQALKKIKNNHQYVQPGGQAVGQAPHAPNPILLSRA